jgi:hypothetical protein
VLNPDAVDNAKKRARHVTRVSLLIAVLVTAAFVVLP